MAQAISKMETTQTAVDWLVKQFNLQAYIPHIQQAKAMEKEQMITAMMYTFHQENTLPYGMDYLLKRDRMREDCEDYFNQTYTNGL